MSSNNIQIPKSHVAFIYGGSFNWDTPIPDGAEVLFYVCKKNKTFWVTRLPMSRIIHDLQVNPESIPDGCGVVVVDKKTKAIIGEDSLKAFYENRVVGWTLRENDDKSGVIERPVFLNQLSRTHQDAVMKLQRMSAEEVQAVMDYAEGKRVEQQPEPVQQGVIQTIATGQEQEQTPVNTDFEKRNARRRAAFDGLTQEQRQHHGFPDKLTGWKDAHIEQAERIINETRGE